MTPLKHTKYLVTGGAGFIGSHICEEIVRQGKELICLDNTMREENLFPWWDRSSCRFVKADVRDFEHIRKHFFGVDCVFHEACSKCTVCREDPVRDLETNALGTFNVLEAARMAHVGKVVHASTGSVNGGRPKSFYGVSKQAGEAYLRAFEEYYPGFRFTSLRYHHVFGSRQNSGCDGGVIPIFIRQALAGGPITVDGDGMQHRLFTSVKDVVEANLICAESKLTDGRVLNVMSDVSISIIELAEKVSEIAGGGIPIVHRDSKPGDIREFKTDNDSLKSIGMTYNNDFDTLLTETFEWYRAHGSSLT